MTNQPLEIIPFTTTLWAWPYSQFLSQQRVHLSEHGLPASPGEYCGDSTKGLAEVQAEAPTAFPLIHQAGHPVIKGDQVGQTQLASPKPLLAGPAPLVIPSVPCDRTPTDLLHHLPGDSGQPDSLEFLTCEHLKYFRNKHS